MTYLDVINQFAKPVITLSGPLPAAPSTGTGVAAPTHTLDQPSPAAPGTFTPVAPYQPPVGGGVIPYTGPGEIITGVGGGGGLQVPTYPGAPPNPDQGTTVPGTRGTGVPGVPNSPTVPSTGYSTPSPAAMPGAGFSLAAVPVWAWVAGAVLVFFALKD